MHLLKKNQCIFYKYILQSFQVPEKHEKKITPKPKVPAKIEEPPAPEGTFPLTEVHYCLSCHL